MTRRMCKQGMISVCSMVCMLIAMSAEGGARGRVHVKDGTVWTDVGTLLRGMTMQMEAPGHFFTNSTMKRESWRCVPNTKLNVVRLDIKLSTAKPTPMSIDQQLVNVDTCVRWAREDGIYIALMNSIDPGSYNRSELLAFWAKAAKRYANETHVFFEMVNEPVAWHPANYGDKSIADLKMVYDTIRANAPATHIALWDFLNLGSSEQSGIAVENVIKKMAGIDYTNTSVAFHWYGTGEQAVKYLMTRYPLLMTEASVGPPLTNDTASLISCEKLKLSWIHLSGKQGCEELATKYIPTLAAKGYTWTPDFLTTSVVLSSRGVRHLPGTPLQRTISILHRQPGSINLSGRLMYLPAMTERGTKRFLPVAEQPK